MYNKEVILQHISGELTTRISRLQAELDDLKQGLASNTKSTAGDKHETSRAMAHNEQERLSVLLDQTHQLKRSLSSIDPTDKFEKAAFGSLVVTEKGTFFLSISLGKIAIDGQDIFCLTANTPMGQALLNKKAGEEVNFNGKFKILNVL